MVIINMQMSHTLRGKNNKEALVQLLEETTFQNTTTEESVQKM